jgi:hypothetical protein
MRSTIHVLDISPVAELFLGVGEGKKGDSVQWNCVFHILKPCLHQLLFLYYPFLSPCDSEHLATLHLNREIDDTFRARETEKYRKLG